MEKVRNLVQTFEQQQTSDDIVYILHQFNVVIMRIFFSWQSDIPQQHSYLLNALNTAASELNFGIEVVQATDGSVGSARIDEQLFKNIDDCSVFFGDVTIVNSSIVRSLTAGVAATAVSSTALTSSASVGTATSPVALADAEACPNLRDCPNPNVMAEVGYAFSKLGFDRVVLLANTEFGRLEDLPFDIRNRRCIGFSAKKSLRKNPSPDFVATLKDAIRNVVNSYPLQVMTFLQKCGPNGAKYAAALAFAGHALVEHINGAAMIAFPLVLGVGNKAALEFETLTSDDKYGLFKTESCAAGEEDKFKTICFHDGSSVTVSHCAYIAASTIATSWPRVTQSEYENRYGQVIIVALDNTNIPHVIFTEQV